MAKKKSPKKYPRVEVEWWDAIHDPDEYDMNSDVLLPAHQITGGYLIRDNNEENFITIAQEYNKDEPHMVRGLDTIPRGMIIRINYKRG